MRLRFSTIEKSKSENRGSMLILIYHISIANDESLRIIRHFEQSRYMITFIIVPVLSIGPDTMLTKAVLILR